MNGFSRFIFCLLLGLAVQFEARATLIVFGDSLTDAGNVRKASLDDPNLATDPPSPPYDAQGRMSNGPIWVDYLADLLGMARPTASLLGGTNYAYAGAMTGNGQTPRQSVSLPPFTQIQFVDNIGLQIQNHLNAQGGFAPNDFVVLWAGANDLAFATRSGPAAGAAIVTQAISNLRDRLITLNANGVTRVLVPNQISAKDAPFWSPLWNPSIPNNGPSQLLDVFTQNFNTGLHQMLMALEASPGFKTDIIEFDAASAFGDFSQFGFANITAPFLFDPNPNKQVSGYLFWDLIHPTTRAHAIIAGEAFEAIPEPASTSLIVAAGIALLGLKRFRRARARVPNRTLVV